MQSIPYLDLLRERDLDLDLERDLDLASDLDLERDFDTSRSLLSARPFERSPDLSRDLERWRSFDLSRDLERSRSPLVTDLQNTITLIKQSTNNADARKRHQTRHRQLNHSRKDPNQSDIPANTHLDLERDFLGDLDRDFLGERERDLLFDLERSRDLERLRLLLPDLRQTQNNSIRLPSAKSKETAPNNRGESFNA